MQQQVEVFFHSQQPYTYVQDADLVQYPSGRLDFPNRYFDPAQAHALYNQYHEQHAWADEVGLDGIMTTATPGDGSSRALSVGVPWRPCTLVSIPPRTARGLKRPTT